MKVTRDGLVRWARDTPDARAMEHRLGVLRESLRCVDDPDPAIRELAWSKHAAWRVEAEDLEARLYG